MSRLSALVAIALVVPTVHFASSAAAQPQPGTQSKPVGPLASYYAGLELNDLHDLLTKFRRSDIYDRAKAAVGRDPLWKSENPDPTWILQWLQQDWSNASDNAETLVYAAYNRAWQASCIAEFNATHAAHNQVAATLQPELTRLEGLTNYYERMAGYAALAALVETTAAAAGIPMDKDPSGPVGFRVTVLAQAIAFHQQSSHGWREFPTERFPTAETLRRDGRELTPDVDFERAAYCALVASNRGLQTPSFANLQAMRQGSGSTPRAAWPTVIGDKTIDKRRLELVAATAPRLTAVRATPDPKPEGFFGYNVTAVKGDTITFKVVHTTPYSYACKPTRRIARIDGSGRVTYEQKCKAGKTQSTTTGTVTFAELPPGVKLAAGDELAFFADVTATKDKALKNTAALKTSLRTLTLVGRHLVEVTRGGKKLSW